MNQPVLLITFNRPIHAQLVFDQIRKVKPKYFYFFNDGPRKTHSDDMDKCKMVRDISKQIDWECKLNLMFLDENLGCGEGPSTAISWAFERESDLIILEDDCLPDISFFKYCEILLDRFKNNEKVFAIGGRNEIGKWKSNEFSYSYFYEGLWGWATWKRAWKHYDYNLTNYGKPSYMEKFHNFYNNDPFIYRPVEEGCERFLQDPEWGVWDYQWSFAMAINNGLVVVPSKNLVKNIGFDHNATHTKERKSKRAKLRSYEMIFPLIHNDNICIDWELDKSYRKYHSFNIFWKLYRFLKKIIKRII